MLERLLRKASRLVFARYRLIVFIFVCLSAASIYSVFHLKIKTDLIDVLPRDNPTVAQFKDFMQKYDILESLTVIVSTENNTVEEHMDLIETLAGKLKRSVLVQQVEYTAFGRKSEFFVRNFPLFLDEAGLRQLYETLSPLGIQRRIRLNYQKLVSPMGSPLDEELINRDPLALRDIVARSLKRSGPDNPFDLSLGYYITKDRSTALIFVKPTGRSRDMEFVKKLRPELDAIVGSALAQSGNPRGVTVRLAGGHILSEEVRQVILHDIVSSTVVSAILIALIIWLAYRVRLVVLLIVGCTTLTSLSMTLAVAQLIFGSLNIVTSVVCGLLIGMYVDYCILTLKRYGDEMVAKNDRRRALELTMTKAGAAMAVSAVTTAMSFFSIIITRFEGLYELGIVSGIGVLICFFTTLFMMNSLMIWVSEGGPGAVLSVQKPGSGVDGLSAIIQRHPRRILYAVILLVLALVFGMTRLRFDNDPSHLGTGDSQTAAAMKMLNQKLRSAGEPLQVMIKADGAGRLDAGYDKLDGLLQKWKSEGLISRADSLDGFLPPPHIQRQRIEIMERLSRLHPVGVAEVQGLVVGELDKYSMVYDGEKLSVYLTAIVGALNREPVVIGLEALDEGADSRVGRFFNKRDMSMVAYLYPAARGWDKSVIQRLREDIAREGSGWNLMGSPILYSEIKTSILRGSALAAAATLGLNLFFIVLFLKKSRYVMMAMLPVCIGFLLTVALMGWLDAPFNFINVGTMALIFGFGVDYGVYVMQAYLREETKDVGNALRLSGKNIIVCAATTIAGCGSLVTARFAGIASIGIVLTIGAICCSAVTLILLPSLLWIERGEAGNGNL
jgi:predicted RND superfamily exporter protein